MGSSYAGGFSSINFVLFVSQKEIIKDLTISSLRIGKKQTQVLNKLHNDGKIENATFIVCNLMQTNKKYSYFDDLEKVSNKNGWNIKVVNNHSKIVLMETNKNYYVLETSV